MVTVYGADAVDFTNNGLCVLSPTSCLVTETLNGEYEVVLVHPIDAAGKHRHLVHGNIIRVSVPQGRTPHVYRNADSADIYRVVTGGMRLYLRSAPSIEAKGIATYKPGTLVTMIDRLTDPTWSEVITPDGRHGWMWSENLEYVRTEGSGAQEVVREAASIREQPFRIYRVVPTLSEITVYARHVFYDLMDNMVGSFAPDKSVTGAEAFSMLSASTLSEHGFAFYSDLDTDAEGVEFEDKNPVEVILGSGGIAEKYHGELVRDWWDVYLVGRVGADTQIQIIEGKNLTGIKYDVDETDVVTRIRPRGEDADGKALYLPEGYIDSPRIGEYPTVKWYSLRVADAKEKKSGDKRRTKEECYELMRQETQRLIESGCDMPRVTLTVNFIDCAQTEEYRQYRALEGVHMGDRVHVRCRRIPVAVDMRVVQYQYNCLTKQYANIVLGTAGVQLDSVPISPKSIADGSIRGGKLQSGAVGTGQLADGAVNALKIGMAAIAAAHIKDAAIEEAHIKDASITSAKIGNAAVTQAKIAEASITNAHIRNAAIDTAKIADAVITAAKIANAAIESVHIKDAAIDTAKIALGAITQALIAQGAIGEAQIADGSITAAKIVSLNADVITAGTLSVERLLLKGEGGLFYAINATDKGLTGEQLTREEYQSAISGGVLVARSVTADKIAARSITANEILAGTITAAEMNVEEIFAANAVIEALAAAMVRASVIEALEGVLTLRSLDTKNGIVINENGVEISAGSGNQYLRVTEEIVEVTDVRSPTVSPRYARERLLTVNPNATAEQMSEWGIFRSLADALATVNGRQVEGKLQINCVQSAAMYGDIVLSGVCGGEIEINGTESTVYGRIRLEGCSCKVLLSALSVLPTAGAAIYAEGCSYVSLWKCTLKGTGADGLYVCDGSRVYATECTLISDTACAAFVTKAAFGAFVNCIGHGELAVQFASLSAMGTVPVGGCSDWGGSLMSAVNVVETGADEEVPEAQEQTTAHYPMTHSDSYAGSSVSSWSWFDDADIRQGITGNSGRIYGCMWFDAAAIRTQLAGKTVNQVGLRLKMLSGYGRGVSVAVQLYGTDMEYDGRSGVPELVTQYGTIGSTVPGEVNTITIPKQVAEDLAAGVICGLVLLSDDTEKYKERAYSKNYARFDGQTSGTEDTVPMLTVVYVT